MSDSTTSLKTILAPIDFSDFSHNALDVATDLASRLGAELILVNVVPAIPDLPSSVSILKEGGRSKSPWRCGKAPFGSRCRPLC